MPVPVIMLKTPSRGKSGVGGDEFDEKLESTCWLVTGKKVFSNRVVYCRHVCGDTGQSYGTLTPVSQSLLWIYSKKLFSAVYGMLVRIYYNILKSFFSVLSCLYLYYLRQRISIAIIILSLLDMYFQIVYLLNISSNFFS